MGTLKHSTRIEMEKFIYDVFDRLDPTKINTDFYKSFFSKMSDKEFDDFFDSFFKDENAYLTWTIETFENDARMENIEKAAKFMNVPLFEHVIYYGEDKNKPLVTPYPVPVGYFHEKRVQQTAIKKNSTSIDVNARDAKTNQVINDDKNSRQSIDENYCMMTFGTEKGIKEFMSFRADDSVMKEEAYNQIRENGYVALQDLPDNVENKAAINMVDVYLICQGIKSDLITPGYLLKKTMSGSKVLSENSKNK